MIIPTLNFSFIKLKPFLKFNLIFCSFFSFRPVFLKSQKVTPRKCTNSKGFQGCIKLTLQNKTKDFVGRYPFLFLSKKTKDFQNSYSRKNFSILQTDFIKEIFHKFFLKLQKILKTIYLERFFQIYELFFQKKSFKEFFKSVNGFFERNLFLKLFEKSKDCFDSQPLRKTFDSFFYLPAKPLFIRVSGLPCFGNSENCRETEKNTENLSLEII